MFYITGSVAANHWFNDYRTPKDTDVICDNRNDVRLNDYDRVDIHYEPEMEIFSKYNTDDTFLDPDMLYSLKLSHAIYDVKWIKTSLDIIDFKRRGANRNNEVVATLRRAWKRIHTRPKLDFTLSSERFFNGYVKRKINHDDLHYMIKFYDRPLFEDILENNQSVKCSKDKFFNLSHDDQVKTVVEEISVLAVERFMIHQPIPSRVAYTKMVHKFVTGMCGGWMSDFILDNLEEIIYFKHSGWYENMKSVAFNMEK